MKKDQSLDGISRRNFIKGLGVGTTAITALSARCAGQNENVVIGPERTTVQFKVNGNNQQLEVGTGETLLDVLRDGLSYTGTKRVCNKGQCGACTVILNGRSVLACQMLAVDADGAKIETIEGLARGEKLHPLQHSFVKHDALQCGFCTPGFIMSSVALLRENYSPSLDEIKKGLHGNVCRCGTYPNVFSAVQDAAAKMRKGG